MCTMYKKDLSYRDITFSSETSHEDFFLYGTISNLYDKCETNKNKIIKIRTVGILRTNRNCFYIKEITKKHNSSIPPDPRQSIEVSVAHMNRSIRCSRMPCTVQLFGNLQWCHRPVIFAQILQPLSASVATLLYETIDRVSMVHSHCHPVDTHDLDHLIDQN